LKTVRNNKRSDAIRLLGIEHERIEQILEIVEGQIEVIDSGSEPDSALVKLAVEYFLSFPDTCHHPKEDLLFRQMNNRSHEDASIVGDLIRDHENLSQLANDVNQEVSSGSTATLKAKESLDALKTFVKSYRHHLESENTKFFPHLLKTLSQDELDAIDFSLFDSSDPVFDQQDEKRFTRLRNEILLRRKER